MGCCVKLRFVTTESASIPSYKMEYVNMYYVTEVSVKYVLGVFLYILGLGLADKFYYDYAEDIVTLKTFLDINSHLNHYT